MLKFELNVEERKTLAKRMEELTGIHPYYTKAPRYAYDIGNYTIDRDGNLLVEAENADLELLTTLMNEGLISGGEDVDAETLQETADEQPAVDLAEGVQMIPAVHPNEQETCEGDSEEAEEDGESEMESAEQIPSEEGEEQPVAEEAIPLDADFSFPISQHNGVSLRNLVNLIYSRGELISKATDGIFLADKGLVDALKDDSCTYAVANFIHAVKEYEEQHGASLEGLTITDEKVTFTGFPTAPDYDHLTAFGHLAILMNQQAVSQKRIQAKEVNDSNEKYALRTWLLRLGMNGPDFKQTRKILLENLSGHAAFRTDEEAGCPESRETGSTGGQCLRWGNNRISRCRADTARLWGRHGADAGGGSVSSQAPNGGRKICETLFHCTDINSENVHYQADKPQKCTRSFRLIFVEYMFFYGLAIMCT